MLFEAVITFLWVVYFWETYLDVRQHRKLHEDKLPAELVGTVTDEKFTKSRLYGLDNSSFGFVRTLFSQVEGFLILWFGALPFLWDYSVKTAANLGYSEEHEVTISLIFMGFSAIFEIVTQIPWELYSIFVIEERHGFNKQTLSTYVSDKLKTIALTVLIGGPTMAGLLHTIKWGGPHFYVYAWLFISFFTLVMLTIYPTFIAPLFNKFSPLEEGELKTQIEALAASIHFPLTKLYVVDGSRRSGHSNAYFYGFFKNKRIVLYDTLMNQLNKDEILAVLGHELGHWKLNHTLKLLIIGEIQIFVSFFLFGQILNWPLMYSSFGFSSQPTIIGMILFFQFIMSPVDHVLGFAMNILSRKFEFQADDFGKKRGAGYGESLRSGLIKISTENLGNLNPDTWYSVYHYSHPPLVERLKALAKEA